MHLIHDRLVVEQKPPSLLLSSAARRAPIKWVWLWTDHEILKFQHAKLTAVLRTAAKLMLDQSFKILVVRWTFTQHNHSSAQSPTYKEEV